MKSLSVNDIFNQLKRNLSILADQHGLYNELISVKLKTLTHQEAIGDCEDLDYPIIKGKEKMLEANFKGARGQAFTDEYGNSSYSVNELLELPVSSNRKRADFIAAFNAIYRHLGICDKTIHCRDSEPKECSDRLSEIINPNEKILLIGLQPRMLEFLASRQQKVRVIDLDEDNISKEKFGITIESEKNTTDAITWCDSILATGSTIVNGTIATFLNQEKPVVYYGVTIGAAAKVLNLKVFCPIAH